MTASLVGVDIMKINKKGLKSNKGFTLVETVVVGVILVILLSFGAGMLVNYTHFSMYKRNNEYARNIFVAAQSALTDYKVSGKLESLYKEIQKDESLIVDASICGNENEGRIYYLEFTKADYELLIQSTESLTGYAKDLYDLLKDYIYTPDIFNAAIRLEFDPVEGMVYSVCYSDRAKAFEASDSDGSDDGIMGINAENRDEHRRYEIILGYYSADTVAKTPAEREKPVINSVNLVNDETLMLTWNMSNKYKALTSTFIYHVDVHVQVEDEVTGKPEERLYMSFDINDKETGGIDNLLFPEGVGINENRVTSKVTYYNYEDKASPEYKKPKGEPTSIDFKAYYTKDQSQKVCLILDAADLYAAQKLESAEVVNKKAQLDADTYKDTFSILRLGFQPLQKIACSVSVKETANYKPSATRKSDLQPVLTGKYSDDSDDKNDQTHAIENARHLFNIRFVEQEYENQEREMAKSGIISDADAKKPVHKYVQKSNIIWGYQKGLIANGNLYNRAKVINDNATAFPSIKELGSRASYTGKFSSSTNAIQNMILRAEKVSGEEKERDCLGLFRENKGDINNLELTNIQVNGIKQSGEFVDFVGTICGVNGETGILANIVVNETLSKDQKKGSRCYVIGGEYVGGIAGSDYAFEKAPGISSVTPDNIARTDKKFENLRNSAYVSGQKYVGGILGYCHGEAITQCINKGSVRTALLSEHKKTIENTDTSDKELEEVYKNYHDIGGIVGYMKDGEIVSCTSTIGSKVKIVKMTDLVGINVGGIVGRLSDEASVKKCGTEGGTVLGDSYVGGIVGKNGNKEDNVKRTLIADGKVNKADVAGRYYVGGVAGINGKGCKIENWLNRGVVTATEAYAGGITGENNGAIEKCNVTADYASKTVDEIESIYAQRATGKYVGGIAGCNNGEIKSDGSETIYRVNSIVIGSDYVGGLVGWNKKNAINDQAPAIYGKIYQVSGGYVIGDTFVGGIVGLNQDEASIYQEMKARPNLVKGQYIVGGIWGGNIVALNGDLSFSHMEANNFLGRIEIRGGDDEKNHSAFVGGAIGYNCFVKNEEGAETLRLDLEKVKELEREQDCDLDKIVNYVEEISDDAEPSDYKLSIIDARVRFQKVSGGVYVGGIIGYNSSKSEVYIEDCTNDTPIEALAYLQSDDRTGLGENVNYAYAGGITGSVSENMVISNCINTSNGTITTADEVTYHGGMAEVNVGKIENCKSYDLGDYSTDYIGGITGRNEGEVIKCSLEGVITGRNVVGGLVSENYLKIEDSIINGNLAVYGQRCGGVTGYNYSKGEVSSSEMKGYVQGSVQSSYIGGIIGYNEGIIKTASIINSEKLSSMSVATGGEYIGGYVGYLNYLGDNTAGCELIEFKNHKSVKATKGYAGGIVGFIEDSDNLVKLEKCDVSASVIADSGIAGGITSRNGLNTKILDCTSSATVAANNGWAGGIAAQNYGTISNCTLNDKISVGGAYAVGGIVAANYGRIENCKVESVKLENVKAAVMNEELDSEGYCMGTIAGFNTGVSAKIIRNNIGTLKEKIDVHSSINNSLVGGVAGKNQEQALITECTVYANVSIPVTGNYTANVGGITGVNSSSIAKTSFAGSVTGDSGTEYGYGGVSGINRGLIESCEASGDITAVGDAGEIVNVGGIVGRQYSGASTIDCRLATEEVSNIKSTEYGYVGGAIGYLDGTLENFNWSDDALEISQDNNSSIIKVDGDYSANVLIKAGHVGGAAGYIQNTGKLSNCRTYSNWKVKAEGHTTDNATGGIVGYSTTGDISNVINYAAVTKTANNSNSVAGIIGRQENSTSNGWTISRCINVGQVNGRERVGGIIGQWKYKGGTVTKSCNYGNISSKYENKSGNYVGGIVGYLYAINSFELVDITDCVNHGGFSGNYKAGILGTFGDMSSAQIRINNCVNLGIAETGGDYTAGIMAGILKDLTLNSIFITNCSNYGSVVNKNAKFSGIFGYKEGNNTTPLYIENCYGISNVKYPISSSANSVNNDNNNFYFTGEVLDKSLPTIEYTIMKEFSVDVMNSEAGNGPQNMIDGDSSTRWSSNTQKKEFSIELTAEEPMEFSQLSIDWYGSDNRIYRYYVEVTTDDGKVQYLYKDPSGNVGLTVSLSDAKNNRLTGIGRTTGEMNTDNSISFEKVEDVIKIKIYAVTTAAYSAINEIEINGSTPLFPDTANKILYKTAKKQQSSVGNKGLGVGLDLVKSSDRLYQADMSGYLTGILKKIPLQDIPGKKLPVSGNPYKDNLITYRLLENILHLNNMEGVPEPENVRVTNYGESYKVSWENERKYLNYNIYVDSYESEDEAKINSKNPKETSDLVKHVRGGDAHHIIIPSEWVGKYMNVFVEAQDSYSGKISVKVAAKENPIFLKMSLPAPKVHLELEGNKEGGYYKAVLDNYDEYKNLPEALLKEIIIEVSGTRISVGNNNKSNFSFDLSGNAYTETIIKSNADNVGTITAFARPKDSSETARNYIKSPSVTRQTQILTYSTLKTKRPATAKFNTSKDILRFNGITLDDMAFTVLLSAATNYETYYRTELLLPDKNLNGLEVVVASSEMRVSSTVSSNVSTRMTQIPEDMLADLYKQAEENQLVTVRSFPYYSQGKQVYYGNKRFVENNISADQLESLGYMNDNVLKQNGYVIVRNGVDDYSVYQSSILQYSEGFVKETKDATYNWQAQSISAKLPDQMPKPVLEEKYEKLEDGRYQFKWDVQKAGTDYQNPEYRVLITGTTAENQEVPILTQTVNEKQTGLNEDGESESFYGIAVDLDNQGYKNINLKVTRVGSLYTKTEAGEENITKKMGSDAEKDYKFYLKLDRIAQPQIKLTNGNKDELNYTITWKCIMDELQLKDLKLYEVKLVSVKNPDEKRFITVDPDFTSQQSINFDLEEFESGDTIKISVKAVAYRPGEKAGVLNYEPVYTDSDDGIALLFEIPERIMTPGDPPESWSMKLYQNSTESLVNPEYICSSEEFTQGGFGFELKNNGNIQDDSTLANAKVAFQMKAYIYDAPVVGGEPSGQCLLSLTEEDEVLIMDGEDISQGNYDFTGISGEYAGKYLVLQLRTTSSQHISSKWSSYYSYHLPKYKLDTLSIAYVNNISSPVEKIDETDGLILATQNVYHDAIMWQDDELTSTYDVRLSTLHYDGEIPLRIVNNSKGTFNFSVMYNPMETNGQITWQTEVLEKPKETIEGSSIYEVSLDDYGFKTIALSSGLGKEIPVKFSLKVQIIVDGNGQITYRLLLPDAYGLDDADYYYTGCVTVKSIAEDENYQDSLRAEWIRIQLLDNKNVSTHIRELEDTDAIDKGVTSTDRWAILKIKGALPWNPDTQEDIVKDGKEYNE